MDKLRGSLQENVLTLLCFDPTAAPVIASVVGVDLFETKVYRDIAGAAITYYNKYKKVAGDHLPDLLEAERNDPNNKLAVLLEQTLRELYALSKTINKVYVLGKLEEFVHGQSLKQAITEAAEAVQQGDLSKADQVLSDGRKQQLAVFDPGTLLTNIGKRISSLRPIELIHTGIKSLDRAGICPARQELLIWMAGPNVGKTHALIQCGKFAALQRLKVAHFTLEMGEPKVARRYVQSYFAIGKRDARVMVPRFKRRDDGSAFGISFEDLEIRHRFDDPNTEAYVRKQTQHLPGKMRIWIKQFPGGQLTVERIAAYLDMLESQHAFVPDMVIVDYLDLMKMDSKYIREQTQRLYIEFRGLAQQRNFAAVSVTQSNRAGEDARVLKMKHFAEDYGKGMHSDNCVSINQTVEEAKLGLARLFVVKARDERKGLLVVISQSYDTGQFCLDDAVMHETKYWETVEASSKK